MGRYDSSSPETFIVPRINGTPVDLRPATTYQSPFLNGMFGDDRIKVTVGPVTRLLDFSDFTRGHVKRPSFSFAGQP
jgi:hypothetical protein